MSEDSAVDRLIERFGGIRPMAAKLDIPVTTVQGWKKRSAIPEQRHGDIVSAAEKHGVSLEGIDLAAAEQPIPDVEEAVKSRLMRLPSPATLAAIAGGLLVTTALILGFIGLYIVKQKTADLSHRINMVEQNIGSASSFEARLAALERQPRTTTATVDGGADLQQRVTALGTEVAHLSTLSQKIEDLQSASGNHDLLQQTLSGLQQTVATVQGSVQGLSQSVDGMRAHIGEIDTTLTQKRSENARQFAILLAIDQLREATATSEPFESEVAIAKTLAHDDSDVAKQLDVLTQYATDGVPTLNELRVEFSDLAAEIVRSNVVGSGKSWFRQALYRLGSVVSIRRISTRPSGTDTTDTIVARAESSLTDDDLGGAVTALQSLDGLPKDVATGWVDSAQRRLAVDKALARLSEISLQRLDAFQTTGDAKP